MARQDRVVVEQEIARFEEEQFVLAQDVQRFLCADFLDERFDGRRIDFFGPFAGKSEQNGAISGVADASEREGAEEFRFDAGRVGELTAGSEVGRKLAGGAHGADGVGTGRTDADFEEIEDAGFHDCQLKITLPELPDRITAKPCSKSV